MATKTYESVAPHDVAFLGLGVMGYPMAGHLAGAGHHVTVYNRTERKRSNGAEFWGKSAKTPREAAAGAKIVFRALATTRIWRA